MITINEAKRLVKRALLANIVSGKRDLAITPIVSGKHGIGKSQMKKSPTAAGSIPLPEDAPAPPVASMTDPGPDTALRPRVNVPPALLCPMKR